MKIDIIMLSLCFIIIAVTSCHKVKPGPVSGDMDLDISDTSVHFYYTAAFSKNKKQKIILAFWDNIPRSGKFKSSPSMMEAPPYITCHLTKSTSYVKFECVGEFNGKTGKGTVDIAGKTFDVSNGRLFLINIQEKPLQVIQINEQFNSPPFDDLSCLDDFSLIEKSILNTFSSCQKNLNILLNTIKQLPFFLPIAKRTSICPKINLKI